MKIKLLLFLLFFSSSRVLIADLYTHTEQFAENVKKAHHPQALDQEIDFFVDYLIDQVQKDTKSYYEVKDIFNYLSISPVVFNEIFKRFKEKYLLKVINLITAVNSGKIVQDLYLDFSHYGRFLWGQNIRYNGKHRGSYYAKEKVIELRLLPLEELIPVLAHELFHYGDRDLYNLRVNLNAIKGNVELDPLSKGYYFFLEGPFKFYKEIIPRIKACEVYTELILSGKLLKPSQSDSQRYQSVLNKDMTCEEFTREELRLEIADYLPFNHEFDKDSSRYGLIKTEEILWHERNGLNYPFFRN